MDQLTIDDLLHMLGQKDVTIRLLERQISALIAENAELRKAAAPGTQSHAQQAVSEG